MKNSEENVDVDIGILRVKMDKLRSGSIFVWLGKPFPREIKRQR